MQGYMCHMIFIHKIFNNMSTNKIIFIILEVQMRSSWLIGTLVTFAIGFSLLFVLINDFIWGASLILLSLVMLLIGLILPEKAPKIVHKHHDTIIEEMPIVTREIRTMPIEG